MCVGGGSGGHITPIVAVIKEIKREHPRADITVWCDRKFIKQARGLLGKAVPTSVIPAGKLRRYANLPWWYRWFSLYHIVHTHIPNLVDLFHIGAGFVTSYCKLRRLRPDVVFCKGGYVCLPVGLAAHLLHIPLVLHDSDTVPGLTNRVLARYARAIGTGAPVENYPSYPKLRTKYIGIPLRPEIKPVNAAAQRELNAKLGFDPERPLVVSMGGGLGAKEINVAMALNARQLIKQGADVAMLIGKGRKVTLDLSDAERRHVRVLEFTEQIADYMKAADVVVTRAGATTMAELAAIRVATVIIPSPYLAGDHQTKNAKVYEQAGATVVLAQHDVEQQPKLLGKTLAELIRDQGRRQQLAKALGGYAKPHALQDMARLILDATQLHVH